VQADLPGRSVGGTTLPARRRGQRQSGVQNVGPQLPAERAPAEAGRHLQGPQTDGEAKVWPAPAKFANSLQLTDVTSFPSGESVKLRCDVENADDDDASVSNAGQMAMEGDPTMKCEDGDWSTRLPVCRETSGRDREFDRE